MKILAGLVLALLIGWIWHGPLGNGERLVAGLESQARASIAKADLPGIAVDLSREPLARVATLSGPANDLQREGLGSQKGVSDHVRDVEGISDVRWAGRVPAGAVAARAAPVVPTGARGPAGRAACGT